MKTTLILLIALTGCTIRVEPIGQPRMVTAARHHAERPKQHPVRVSNGTTTVNATWLTEYHRLEAAHGNYTHPDDTAIKPLPNGKFSVPRSLLKHFSDLSRVPESPAPKPTPNLEFNPN